MMKTLKQPLFSFSLTDRWSQLLSLFYRQATCAPTGRVFTTLSTDGIELGVQVIRWQNPTAIIAMAHGKPGHDTYRSGYLLGIVCVCEKIF